MIQALIVDDEPMHIQGLVRHIAWRKLGYEEPLTALSGEEALEILERNRIDVLITDVSMPGMSGIELLSRLRSMDLKLQSMQTVMISGYDEFEFVREAVHLGAKAYVLKPIKTEELEEKLSACRAAIEKREQIERETCALKEKVAGSHDLVQERFINDLIGGRILGEELLASWRHLLELPEGPWQTTLYIFGTDRPAHSTAPGVKEQVLLGEGLSRTVKVGLSGFAGAYIGRTGADEAAVLCLNASPVDRARLGKQLSFIQEVLKEQYHATVTIGVSRECRGWEEVPLLYKEVKHMIANGRLAGAGQILYFDRVEMTEYREFRLREEYIPEIVRMLEQGDSKGAEIYYHHAFDLLLTEEPVSFSYVQAFGMGLISEMARKMKAKESGGDMNIRMWQRLIDCTGTGEIREAVLSYMNQYSMLKQREQTAQQHHLIHQIARYLEEHLQDNVTVKQLAGQFHLNSSYLSVLFKKEMGFTISDFVQERRMAKAKELLQDPGIKVYEVAEQVGFQTAAYFAFLFKKVTGVTPQEFRDYHYGE
jgi:two-component system, response regulator YesN